VKQELKVHLLPLLAIFIFISLFWLIGKVAYFDFIYLFFGLLLGSFLLDLDHLIFWLYVKPNLEESRLARLLFEKKDYRSILSLLETTHKKHTNLVFHHFFFQVVLSLVSLFVFTSSGNVFGMALLVAINTHLLVDEIKDYRFDPRHLQEWLFARESKQLPIKSIKNYLIIFIFLLSLFIYLLLKSRL